MKSKSAYLIVLAIAATLSFSQTWAAPRSSKEKSPTKALPEKPIVKRTVIDFSNSDSVVVMSPKAKRLSDAIEKSANEVQVRSRVFVPAPAGDEAEPLSAMQSLSQVAPSVVTKPAATPARNTSVAKTSATPAPVAPRPLPEPTIVTAPTPVPRAPILPPVVPQEMADTPEPTRPLRTVAEPLPISAPVQAVVDESTETSDNSKIAASSVEVKNESRDPFFQGLKPNTYSFIRSGYLAANYSKFDGRMKNGASSMGLGVARGFETSWGEFEARASFDIYHAMDQSVSVDNIRMLATRTEVAYWLSHSRVKPGLTLGLGLVDYSVRSYRSVSSASGTETVTLKTHAKAQAFTAIPGTSLRIELGSGVIIDAQTEFVGILGGDASDAVQGLGFNFALGWIF